MRVFGIYGTVDILSNCLSLWAIPLYGCMDRNSCYIQFNSKALPPDTGEPAIYLNPLNNYPITVEPSGDHQRPLGTCKFSYN